MAFAHRHLRQAVHPGGGIDLAEILGKKETIARIQDGIARLEAVVEN